MANELSMTVTLTYTPSTANQVKIDPPAFSNIVSMTGDNVETGVRTLAVADVALSLNSDIGTEGYILIKNLEASGGNSVDVGLTASYAILLKPGEFALFRSSGAIFVTALVGAASIQYWMYED